MTQVHMVEAKSLSSADRGAVDWREREVPVGGKHKEPVVDDAAGDAKQGRSSVYIPRPAYISHPADAKPHVPALGTRKPMLSWATPVMNREAGRFWIQASPCVADDRQLTHGVAQVGPSLVRINLWADSPRKTIPKKDAPKVDAISGRSASENLYSDGTLHADIGRKGMRHSDLQHSDMQYSGMGHRDMGHRGIKASYVGKSSVLSEQAVQVKLAGGRVGGKKASTWTLTTRGLAVVMAGFVATVALGFSMAVHSAVAVDGQTHGAQQVGQMANR